MRLLRREHRDNIRDIRHFVTGANQKDRGAGEQKADPDGKARELRAIWRWRPHRGEGQGIKERGGGGANQGKRLGGSLRLA